MKKEVNIDKSIRISYAAVKLIAKELDIKIPDSLVSADENAISLAHLFFFAIQTMRNSSVDIDVELVHTD